jgi:hypothetical protein
MKRIKIMSLIEHYKDDISTIFSIVPFEVREFKPGLYPGNFNIPACRDEKEVQSLEVGASEYLLAVAGRKEAQRIVTPSYIIAESVVKDFFDGQLWTTPEEKPGLCWIQGKISVEKFVVLYKEIYARIKDQQRKWFVRLCKQTDNEWKKQHNYRVVSDQARFASYYLGLDSEWLHTEDLGTRFNKCPACNVANDPQNVVCTGCSALLTPELFAAGTKEEKFRVLRFAKQA